jgi:ABC-type branched-subunit amino acid transport system ATPase component
LDELHTGYGKKQVLNGVSLDVMQGEIVAIIGHNAAGKSTILKATFGLLPIWSGTIVLDGCFLKTFSPREMLLAGVAYLPQGNRVFKDLTVNENLRMGGLILANKVQLEGGIERGLDLFPILKKKFRRPAGSLSGGERQMLALASALVLSPRLLLLDEPSLGLAPSVVTQALQHIVQLSGNLDMAVLIVEQKVRQVLEIAHRVLVLRNGKVSYSGRAQTLQDENKLRDVYF